MRRILTLLMGAILLLGLLPIACTKVTLDDSTKDEGLLAEIPFQLHGSMILMEISVDDSTPLSFIFDTAAGGTIVSARTTARLGFLSHVVYEQRYYAGLLAA